MCTVIQLTEKSPAPITWLLFSKNIASFNRNIRANLNEKPKIGRACFKYFVEATLNDLIYCPDPILKETKIDTVVVYIGM